MDIVEIVNGIRTALETIADEYLKKLEKDSADLKALKEKIVFCQNCRFSRVDMSKGCGYFCGHPNHVINMECHALDFCSFGVKKPPKDNI